MKITLTTVTDCNYFVRRTVSRKISPISRFAGVIMSNLTTSRESTYFFRFLSFHYLQHHFYFCVLLQVDAYYYT